MLYMILIRRDRNVGMVTITLALTHYIGSCSLVVVMENLVVLSIIMQFFGGHRTIYHPTVTYAMCVTSARACKVVTTQAFWSDGY